MLRGFNWARWLFVLWFGYNLIGNIARSPLRLMAPSLFVGLVFGAVVYLLFRPAATAFFRGRTAEKAAVPSTNASGSGAETAAQAACAECSSLFSIQDLISYGGVHVCGRCKPIFLQRLREGAKIVGGPAPARNDES
jgi:hypothetical protein